MVVDIALVPPNHVRWLDTRRRSRSFVAVHRSHRGRAAANPFAVWIVTVEMSSTGVERHSHPPGGIGADSVRDKVDVHVEFGANFGVSCLSSWA
jgi:hypothetical protein